MNIKMTVRMTLLLALALTALALWLPTLGADPHSMSTETWVETAAAQQQTLEGRCGPGEKCYEMCESFNTAQGTVFVPLGFFQCQ